MQRNPSRIKIHMTMPSTSTTIVRVVRKSSTTACEDKEIIDRSSLNLTGQLSMLSERVRFFRSDYATQNINTILSSELVVGHDKVSVSIVLQTLKREGCQLYIFGGMVRDQFLGVPSSDIDMDVGCSLRALLAVCRRKWGTAVCSTNANHTIVHIGTPHHPLALDLASIEEDFYGPLAKLEYTANALAYDLNGLDVVLDITGHGVEDTCARKIRIPSEDGSQSSWEAWSTPDRLYRYWKLRFKGFTAVDCITCDYIISEVKGLIEADTPRGLGFKQFYCRKVFLDSYYIHTENVCYKTASGACEMAKERAQSYNTLLAEDLGIEYVQSLALPTCSCGSTVLSPRTPQLDLMILTLSATPANSVMNCHNIFTVFCYYLLLYHIHQIQVHGTNIIGRWLFAESIVNRQRHIPNSNWREKNLVSAFMIVSTREVPC